MFGNGFGNDAATQGALTRADLFEGFNNQGVNNKLNDMATGLCNSFAAVNSNLCQGFNGVSSNLNQGVNSINANIAENRYAQGQCCFSST